MINGMHAIIYSKDADADRKFLRDVLALTHVDAGEGWLIFGLPPSEVAFHPSDSNDVHELYLMCEDVEAFIAAMRERGMYCDEIADRGWGLVTEVTLPGGGRLGVYQPRHARPEPMGATPKKKKTKDKKKSDKKKKDKKKGKDKKKK